MSSSTLSPAGSASTAERLFNYDRWRPQLARLAPAYQQAAPFPHIALDGFLDGDLPRRLEAEFPAPSDLTWIQYKHFNENKLGKSKRDEFPATIGRVIDELNSPEFVAWLAELTGIPGLFADPRLEGGGMHQTERNGFLNIHTDFTAHHFHPTWRRRCNLILYLNEGWQPEWGGALEFWDRDVQNCRASSAPVSNRAVIFNTTDISFHGYPEPVTCPPERTRKSLALYYYTEGEVVVTKPRSTIYRGRPQDGAKRALIWADTQAIRLYTAAKKRLGLNDELVSQVLGWFSRNHR